MAQPYEKNGRWYIRYKDARGVWRDKATNARTKTEARRLQLELERKTERQRLGLEPLPSDTPEMTFGAAMDLWWSSHGRRLLRTRSAGSWRSTSAPSWGRCRCPRSASGSRRS